MTGTPHPPTPIPADDPSRRLTISHADDADLPHVGIVGDTYTILISGDDTAGRYCLIDMLVPPGGGPAPHRHDFEELFHLLAGEIEVTFRGEATTARTGQTVNIPANAPHSFRNVSDRRGPVAVLLRASRTGCVLPRPRPAAGEQDRDAHSHGRRGDGGLRGTGRRTGSPLSDRAARPLTG